MSVHNSDRGARVILIRIVMVMVGVIIVLAILSSAIRTFVLPRGIQDRLTRLVFRQTRRVFDFLVRRVATYEERDSIMALYAPISLLLLPVAWLIGVWIGYGAIFWGSGVEGAPRALETSGSSLMTLGFAAVSGLPFNMIAFSEAGIGLLLAALLIAYLPTMYSTWSRRELTVALLEVRAGSPPSAEEMILRFQRMDRLDRLADLWQVWEEWFVDLEESHTSLGPLAFFRSPQPERSWITAAGAVLDAASIMVSAVDAPRNPDAQLCIRAGYLALRRIASFFTIEFDPEPSPTGHISISRLEFDGVCERLISEGVPLKTDLDQAWRDFAGWRVNYDTVLLKLAALTMAPYAPWSSDRSLATIHH